MRAHVVGNAAWDETLRVAALPEPGASILATPISTDLGGKGANQAVVMARAGLPVRLVAAVGRDVRGEAVRAALRDEGLAGALIETGAPTDASVILAAEDGANCVVTTNAAAEGLSPEAATRALDGAGGGDLLVMQGNLSGGATAAALKAARERGLVACVNPSPLRPYLRDLWPAVAVAFLNEGEAVALGGADALLAAGVGRVVLTLGERGAALLGPGSQVRVPAHPARVLDPTGAGDCFMGTALASAALRGTALDARALGHAARAAALCVGRPGTRRSFPTREEMTAILGTG